ncbi:MAG: sugar porter family MFS transporter [Parachlamydiales bacterium]|nr:sugar porter family MFS transporter [Parachlamydiales bacterium]
MHISFKEKHFLNSFIYAFIASFGGFLFGYQAGIISAALLFLKKSFQLTIFEQQFLVSIILIGGLLGSYVGGFLSDKFGRKKTFFISLSILIISTLMQGFSQGKEHLMISRFIAGISIGIFTAIVPMYIAEISDPKYRGRLVSLYQFFLVSGILISNFVGVYFSKSQNWQMMFILGIVPAIFMFLGCFFIPESPSWLSIKNRQSKAIEVLKNVRLDINNSEIFQKNDKNQKKISFKSLFEKNNKSALIVGMGLNIFRQITGINIVTYYAPIIFQIAGLIDPKTAMIATTIVSFFNILANFLTLWLVDIIGRKPLLITGLSLMAASLIGIVLFFILKLTSAFLVVFLLTLFKASFAIGLGTNSWLINSEIYSAKIRGRANGISTFINWGSNYLVSMTFLSMLHFFGTNMTFFSYAMICIMALIFVVKKVPETKGKDFLEVQKFFNK